MTESERRIVQRAMVVLLQQNQLKTWLDAVGILQKDMGKPAVESMMKLSLLDLLSGISLGDLSAAAVPPPRD